MRDECPCNGCKDRSTNGEPNCHTTCYDRYIPWSERRIARSREYHKNKREEDVLTGYRVNNVQRAKKKVHKAKR